jgi:hypothetical protein
VAGVDLNHVRIHVSKLACALLVLIISGAILAGCEISVGSSEPDSETSDGEAVEMIISAELAEQGGVAPNSISCPEKLVHEEGKRYECTVVHPSAGEQVIDVTMRSPTGFTWLVRGG